MIACQRQMVSTRIWSLLAGMAAILIASSASAQMDLSGQWRQLLHMDAPQSEAEIGDYQGLPINAANRMRADTWTATKWEQLEHECEPHPADYAPIGPGSMRVWSDVDPATQSVTLWHTEIMWMQPTRDLYMDNRPHPPTYAAHTWQGFSTAHWNADMLEVDTDHLKEAWLRRNGLARSARAHLKEFFIRHDDYLTLLTIVHDPVYLSEPLLRSAHWVQDLGYHPIASVCTPSGDVPHPKGWVATIMPGTNTALEEYAAAWGVPLEGLRGGAQTLYPEYQDRLQDLPVPVPKAKTGASTAH